MQSVVGIDLGGSVVRAMAQSGAASLAGRGPVRRELPLVLARGAAGHWEVGLAAQAAALMRGEPALSRWAEVLSESHDATRGLGLVMGSLRRSVETGGIALDGGRVVVSLPPRWASQHRERLDAAARSAGLVIDTTLGRLDAAAHAMARRTRGTVLGLVLDADGVEAAVFAIACEGVSLVARVHDARFTLDEVDALLLKMAAPNAGPGLRGSLALALATGQARRALLAGEPVELVALDDQVGAVTTLRLRAAQREAALGALTEAVAAVYALALHDAGLDRRAVSAVVALDLLGESEALREALETRLSLAISRADSFAAAEGAARYSAALLAPVERPSRMTPRGGVGQWVRAPERPASEGSASEGPAPLAPPPSEARSARATLLPPPNAEPATASPRTASPEIARATEAGDAPAARAGESQRPRPLSLPPEESQRAVRGASLPPTQLGREGLWVGAPTAAAAVSLRDAKGPRDGGVWPLSWLLLRIERARLPYALLELESAEGRWALAIEHGRPTLGAAERGVLRQIFAQTEGRWRLVEAAGPREGATLQWSMFAFLVEGVQSVLRGATQAELEAAVVPGHEAMAPAVREHRRWMVFKLGLTERERRMVEQALDGQQSLGALLGGAAASRSGLLHLLCLLTSFDALQWVVPPTRDEAPEGPSLEALVARAPTLHHFALYGVHWSAGRDEIDQARRHFVAQWGPGSAASRAHPALTAQLMRQADAAWAVLSHDRSRVAYTRKTFPTVSFEMLATVVQGRVVALSMQEGAEAERDEARRLLRELSPELWHETEELLIKKQDLQIE